MSDTPTTTRKPTAHEVKLAVFHRLHMLAHPQVCLNIDNRSLLSLDARAAFAQLLRELRSMSLPEISSEIGYRSSSGAQAAMSRHNKRIIELKRGAKDALRDAGFSGV